VIKEGKIIGQAYHHKAGRPHAEALALKKASDLAAGAEMFVTLEPCCNYGRTPPCTKAIIRSGIKRVVIGTIDPNPAVNGRGIRELQDAGIEIKTGVLEKDCKDLNRTYNKFMATGLPYVTIKWAQSIDGRIATRSGSSQWISSPDSLDFAHELRSTHDAIVVGARTANRDNPLLTVRRVKGRNPLRIVLTASGRLKHNLSLLTDGGPPTLVVTTRIGAVRFRKTKGNIEILALPARSKGVDLNALLRTLGKRQITSILVEGGSGVITSFLKQGLADRIIVIVAPILVGDGINAVADLNVKTIGKSVKFKSWKHKMIGPDLAIFGELR